MKKPERRGKPIDDRRKAFWLDQFDGYRIAVNDDRLTSWLNNFQDRHKDLGARILDAIIFIKNQEMEKALKVLVSRLPGWHKSPTRRRGKWKFVAFSISAGESGDTMLHKSRIALGLTSQRYHKLFIHKADLLNENLSIDDNVVFIDDFAGTGLQACRAWRGDIKEKITGLSELLPGNPKTYLILIAAGKRAIIRITRETKLKVITSFTLEPCDDIFSQNCKYFNQQEKDGLLEYCKKADPKNPRGFGNCGFVIVLAHKTPNNSIPVLHANHRNWRGLFPRH